MIGRHSLCSKRKSKGFGGFTVRSRKAESVRSEEDLYVLLFYFRRYLARRLDDEESQPPVAEEDEKSED